VTTLNGPDGLARLDSPDRPGGSGEPGQPPQKHPLRRLWHRVPTPTHRVLVGLAIASLLTQSGIVITGGAVRLTGSGLGCPDWPHCTSGRFTPTPEMGLHGVIEFGNRLLTVVVGLVALTTLLAVLRTLASSRPRRDLLTLSVVLLSVVPAQAVVGGITVWTDLNPWVVMFHFLVSAFLVGIATLLVRRAQRPGGQVPQPMSHPWLERLAGLVLVVTAVTVYLGTVVTGSGPHAGDPDSPRTGLDVALVTHIHADAVLVLIGLSIGLFCMARALGSPGRITTAAGVLLGLELAQGVLGFVQYQLALPELLVSLHMVGAVLMIAAAVDVVLAARWLSTSHPAGERQEATDQPEESSAVGEGSVPPRLLM